jgi:hypothetical protein
MNETLDDFRRNMPLGAMQGEQFVRQEKLWSATNDGDGQPRLSGEDAEQLLQTEAQSLEDRYWLRLNPDGYMIFASSGAVVKQIATRCEAFNITHCKANTLQEEQERGLSP